MVKWEELSTKGVGRQGNTGCILALIMWRMMLMMILVMKCVRRQGNTGCILALIMSRMMLMMFWCHPYQHQTGRALRQRNGGCRRVPEAGNDLHQEHYSVKLYITKSFFMKGVLRQRNTGCILALSVSRMMIMNTISSLSSPKRADTLAKERRGASKAFLRQLSRRAPEAGNDLHQEHYSFRDEFAWVLGRG